MYDAARYYARKASKESSILNDLKLQRGAFVLSTVHRAENTDNPARLRAVIKGLALVSESLPVILPLHPRTRKALARLKGISGSKKKLQIISPVGYLDMVMLEKSAGLIATDSGGVQKEAFFYKVPCVTLRTETEWVELVKTGWNRIVPPVSSEIVATEILKRIDRRGKHVFPYGRGNAARKIVEVVKNVLEEGPGSYLS